MSRYGRDSRDSGRDSREQGLECKIYVGDLAKDTSEKDLERAFNYYGPLRSVWVARNPAGFAFVEFEDNRDADDAVQGLDGTTICGERVRVEHSSGKVRPKPWARRGGPSSRGSSRRGFDPSDRCYECGEHGHYAYDCKRKSGGGSSRRRSRSRSRSPYDRDRRRSRSRSRGRNDRSVSRSPRRHSRSRSVSRDRSRSKN